MSFSSKVKEEIAKIDGQPEHCNLAELAAMIAYGGVVEMGAGGPIAITFHTENDIVAERFDYLLRNTFDCLAKIHVTQHHASQKHCTYRMTIDEEKKVIAILKGIGMMTNLGQIEEDDGVWLGHIFRRNCCQRAFLRGAFLTSGSITDPEKNYHFEVVCASMEKASIMKELIRYFGLEAKIVLRKRYYVVYIKEGAMISDILNNMGAHVSLLEFENIRVIKDVRNTINRRVNCETANINKTVSAARKQIEDIEYIESSVGLQKLQPQLQEIARVRLEEPDATLKELGEMLSPPVGKSGVNHRLRKISQAADHIREFGCV